MQKTAGRQGAGSSRLTTQPVRKDSAIARDFNTAGLGNPFTGRKGRMKGGTTK
jgi:hypothetical protein